ncbi:MAG: DUF916 domain-containing protein [bacterium]|nr:DUF916 domain-containing protein [bacterium]
MKSNLVIKGILIGILYIGISIPVSAQSVYSIENLGDPTVYNDFVVGPGKVQLDMKPGETKTTLITLTNRLGSTKTFTIGTEDIRGSNDPAQTVVLLGSDRGPYSLKDYIKVASSTVVLNHSERVSIPVTISVPADAQPGGLYGSVILTTGTSASADSPNTARNPIITRIGTLFFIRVAGDVKADGELTKFSLKNDSVLLGSTKSIDFRLLFENKGTVHLNPYGLLTVKNVFGATVGKIEVEPWFALPASLRLREVTWNPSFLFGRYVATAEINRGYNDVIDTQTISFWVIPWKIIAIVFIGLMLIIGLFKWIFSKFSFVRK